MAKYWPGICSSLAANVVKVRYVGSLVYWLVCDSYAAFFCWVEFIFKWKFRLILVCLQDLGVGWAGGGFFVGFFLWFWRYLLRPGACRNF